MHGVAGTGNARISVPVAQQPWLLDSSDAQMVQAQTQVPVLTLVGIVYFCLATAFAQFVDLHCLLIQDFNWAMQVATKVCKVSRPNAPHVVTAKQAVSSKKTSRPIRNESSIGI